MLSRRGFFGRAAAAVAACLGVKAAAAAAPAAVAAAPLPAAVPVNAASAEMIRLMTRALARIPSQRTGHACFWMHPKVYERLRLEAEQQQAMVELKRAARMQLLGVPIEPDPDVDEHGPRGPWLLRYPGMDRVDGIAFEVP